MNNYPNPQQTPLPHERFSRWWKLQSKGKQLVLVVLLVGLLAACGLCSAVANAGKSQQSVTPTSIPVATELPTQAPTVKPTPTATATPKPTPTPIPTPTPAPVQQAPQQPPQTLTVTFTGESATDGDKNSYVAVHTLPGAALTISVKYCSGRNATSESLKGTQYADAGGDNIWTWDPDTTCHGNATAYVTASLNGQSASNSVSFPVS